MVDVESKIDALKAAWVTRIINNTFEPYIINDYLKKNHINIFYILHGDISKTCILQDFLDIPQFYADIVCAYTKFKHAIKNTNLTNPGILKQPIWFNSRFKDKSECLFYKTWAESNILFVKDLFDEYGNFISIVKLLNTLKQKHNWIIEYMVMKNIFNTLKSCFNFSNAIFTNISNNEFTILYSNRLYQIFNQKSNFFYNILSEKKLLDHMSKHIGKSFFQLH